MTSITSMTATRTFDWTAGVWTSAETPEATTSDTTDTPVPVDVSILLDRSGSMAGLVADVVGGINAFLADQRTTATDRLAACTVTLAQFDSQDPYEVLASARPVDEIADLTAEQYQPRGATPLLDAVGTLLDDTERRVGSGPADGTIDPVVVVFTDGLENASRQWNRAALFDRITALEAAGWTFVFLGANQDAYLEAGGLGFAGANTQNFRGDGLGSRYAMAEVSRGLSSMRSKQKLDRDGHKLDFFDGHKDAERDDDTR